MTYPTESFAGAATPTHVQTTFSASAMSGYFHNLTDWVELGTNDPLGTSGDFVITVDYGKASEEKIRCSSLDANTGLITFVERGFDDTTPAVHSAGLASKPNCFPVLSASDWQALQDEIAVVGATAQSAQNDATDALSGASQAIDVAGLAEAHAQTAIASAASKVASVTATNGTVTVSGTATNPTIGVGTVPYSQLSGVPTSLPPSGSAGGDLTGTYPNPSVIAGSTSQAGKLQLTNSTSSTSTTTAATPASVKSAYDLATTANSAASTAQSTADAKVASVTAGDSTITVAGTATAPTVKVTANTFDPYGAAASKVASVTAGDSTVTIGGTATAPTVAVTANTFDAYGAAASKVASVTAGDTSITVGGTATAPTVAVNQANLTIAESQVTGLVTDLSGKVPTTRTISTTSPLTGGGDLSANRTLAINDASTSAKGAVQLTDSTSSTSTTTAATPNSVKTSYDLANAALPKAGGTMSGDIDLNSVARIKNLVLPQAATDVARAGQLSPFTSISVNSTSSIPLKVWNGDPANITTFTSQTVTLTSGIMGFTAVSLPYAVTLTGVAIWQTVGAVPGTTGAVYQLGLYDTNGNLLASTPNNSGNAFLSLTGFFGWAFSSTYSATAGNYMIGMLWNSGTGGSPTVPVFGKPSNAGTTQVNANCPTPSSGKLDQRACTAGTGRTTLYNPMNVTPTANNSNFWAGLY